MSQFKTDAFRDLLSEQHDWPCDYTFKFIVPKDKVSEVEALFPNSEIQKKESAKGAYISVTATIPAESPDLVIAVYEQASSIDGLIAL